jgi:hypothetical protein
MCLHGFCRVYVPGERELGEGRRRRNIDDQWKKQRRGRIFQLFLSFVILEKLQTFL